MTSYRLSPPAPENTGDSAVPTPSRPVVARAAADPLALAVRQAIATLLPGGAALHALENASTVPFVGLNIPDLVQ